MGWLDLLWIGLGALAAGVIAYTIYSVIKLKDLRAKMLEKDVHRALIASVNKGAKTVTLDALDRKMRIEVKGTGIDSEVVEGDIITA